MTKVKLMLMIFYRLGLPLETKDEILEVVKVLDIAQELEPFKDGVEVANFFAELFYDGEVPQEDLALLTKAGSKWFHLISEVVKRG